MDNHSVPQPERKHLLFLDGLRGLAALYVVANHSLMQVRFGFPAAQMSRAFIHATTFLVFGQMSVDIFIVLSGFCLMIPVARGDGYLRGGVLEFAKRRARRILPPYYAALALSLLAFWLIPALSNPRNVFWMQALPAFTPSVVVSHLLLVHNLSPLWLRKIDYPLWSVATEWQIYFVFALVLLPIWRRFGLTATLAAGFVLGLLPHFLFRSQLEGACFHFIGLFALGMAGANLAYAKSEPLKAAAGWPGWGWLSAAVAAIFIVLAGTRTHSTTPNYVLNDVLVGVATTGLLLVLTRQATGVSRAARGPELVIRVLEARPVAALGAFSYSLYLIHAPLLALLFMAESSLRISAVSTFLLTVSVGIPICVGAAYLFHRLFERPFMSERRPRIDRSMEKEAVAASAP